MLCVWNSHFLKDLLSCNSILVPLLIFFVFVYKQGTTYFLHVFLSKKGAS